MVVVRALLQRAKEAAAGDEPLLDRRCFSLTHSSSAIARQDMPDSPCSISTRGRHFVDEEGRALQLRGINVGGGSKVPTYVHGL